MPIYVESSHRWLMWLRTEKDEGPVWPPGLTKAAWDKKKAILSKGKTTGITEALQAAKKAFDEALRKRGTIKAGDEEQLKKSREAALVHWKGTDMAKLRTTLGVVAEKAGNVDEAYVGSLAPTAAIKKTKAAAGEIETAAKLLLKIIKIENFDAVWEKSAPEVVGQNAPVDKEKGTRGVRDFKEVAERLQLYARTELADALEEVRKWEHALPTEQEDIQNLQRASTTIHRRISGLAGEMLVRIQDIAQLAKDQHVTISNMETFKTGLAYFRKRTVVVFGSGPTPARLIKEGTEFLNAMGPLRAMVDTVAAKAG